MRMKILLIMIFLFAYVPRAAAADNVSPAVIELYQQTRNEVESLSQTKVGTYAKDVLDEARKSLFKAQEGLAAKNEKGVKEAVEKVQIEMVLAKVKAEEREATEKTGMTRAKVKMLEQKLADLLGGKGGQK
ncbi:MAG: DUF4398 domain-containing protein [Nitrospirae bacterium]|nr:DUF4398 domain-containing protein [Nitrospirota bacterium]MCL5976853.1 DUF4398 domain-containing protein [Nitrospirota bacterium]